MGAAVNDLALHGGIVRPFGSTFLVFADYMRRAIRLSALVGLPVAWVFTHDSVAVGEDGPTRQPVEHLAALRAIPGLTVVRPADANETVAAWRVAIEQVSGPVCLVLTRQDVPVLPPGLAAEGVAKGAYVLQDPRDPPVDVVLVGTGSEVSVSVEAGSSQGWSRYADVSVSIDRFGASAPGAEVLGRLGITPEAVAAAAREVVARRVRVELGPHRE